MTSRFPDPRGAPRDEPIAWGGDLEPETLLDAYRHGIFPWPTGDGTLYWWSPDPRAVIPLDALHVSRSLRRTLRSGRLRCTFDEAFDEVIAGCADRPDGTWLVPRMVAAYRRLHRAGLAHSVEVRDGAGAVVGGVYGVALGGAFMGESMFSRVTDASKVGLVALVAHLRARGFALFDVQVPHPHLAGMGAVALRREAFLDALAAAVALPVRFDAGAAGNGSSHGEHV